MPKVGAQKWRVKKNARPVVPGGSLEGDYEGIKSVTLMYSSDALDEPTSNHSRLQLDQDSGRWWMRILGV